MKGEEKKNPRQEEPKEEKKPSFWKTFFLAYGLMLLLYLYFMCANLSMAPKYVYTQF